MGIDLFEVLVNDTVRDVRGLSSSAVASQLAILTIVTLGLLESGLLAWRRSGHGRARLLREAAAAAVMGVGGLIVGVVLAGLFVLAFAMVAALSPSALTDLWARKPVVGFVTAFIAWDFVGYLYHRLGHGTAIGWAAHRPHHTGTDFTLSLAWRQSWLPVHAVVLPVVAIGGWSLSTIVVCAAVSNVMQAMQHSATSVAIPGWLQAVVMTPVQHRRHHQTPDAEHNRAMVNLGPIFTAWDRVGGTYVAAPLDSNASYGVATATNNPLRLQLEGWSALARKR